MVYHHPSIHRWTCSNIVFDLLNICPPFHALTGVDRSARKLKDFLDNHVPDCRWHLEDICKEVGLFMTSRQARRLFKACTGMGFVQYGKKRRLEFAARQLRTTDAPIKVVALDAGYRYVSTFTNSFTKYFHYVRQNLEGSGREMLQASRVRAIHKNTSLR